MCNSGKFRKERLGLYRAALNGDWKTAQTIITSDARFVSSSVTEEHQTALHIAAGAKQTDFVRKLVNWRQTQERDLELQDENGNTAFCLAVIAGSVPVANILLKKVPRLALIRGGQNSIPLFIAVIFGRHEMARLLFRETEDHLDHIQVEHVQEIFFTCIETDMFDLALELLGSYNDLAVTRRNDNQTALHMLAGKPSAFDNKKPGILKKFISSSKESRDDIALELVENLWKIFLEGTEYVRKEIAYPFNLLFKAAERGNYEFLATLIRMYPELIWETDSKNRTIFHIAVMHRHVNIFRQIYGIGSIKDALVTYKIPCDNSGPSDNMLHLAAKMSLPDELNIVSGSALQMQRELLWFQEVENMVQPSDREKEGLECLTPQKLFSIQHKELLKQSEKWMRETSTSCLIVATLITTVVFLVGFITTGINDNTKGFPVQINHTSFHVFVVSEAIGLSFSMTSMLMFLSILTSRYTEDDFLKSLPLKLMLGLAALFISMVAMVAAFNSIFFLAYRDSYNPHNIRRVPLLVCGFASLPAALFVLLQYPLLRDIFHSTCCSRSLFRPTRSMFI
ncbi:hypothetical protein PTKIN_Ptkin14bG0078400 [Pterospermum kingtungense]